MPAPERAGIDVDIVAAVGELDLLCCGELRSRIERSLRAGQAVIVDLSDCTYVDTLSLEALAEAHRTAVETGRGFVLVLPYGAPAVVSRLFLELVPDLVRYPIVATRASALRLARSPRAEQVGVDLERLRTLRLRVWELARRHDELARDRDVLRMELRNGLARRRGVNEPAADRPTEV